jgi:hypothetical protein
MKMEMEGRQTSKWINKEQRLGALEQWMEGAIAILDCRDQGELVNTAW